MSRYRFKITFSSALKPDSSVVFEWDVLSQLPSDLWVKNLKHCLTHDYPFYARFSGFLSEWKTADYLSSKLNRVIELINKDGLYHIAERSRGEFSQEFSNIIHHHFEVLHGSIENPSRKHRFSSPIGKAAIAALNHLIHDMESLHRQSQSGEETFRAVLCEMPDSPRYKMPQEFYEYFKSDIDFGDLVGHYGMVGKTWWEVFLDGDEEIFPEAIRPLNIVSGEFDLFFSDFKMRESQREEFYEFLREQRQDPSDPSLGLGYLPLAKLRSSPGQNQQEDIQLLKNHSAVQKVELYDQDKLVAERGFPLADGLLIFHDVNDVHDNIFLFDNVPHQVLCFQTDEKGFELRLSQLFFNRDKSFYLGIWTEEGQGEIVLKSENGWNLLEGDTVLRPGDFVQFYYKPKLNRMDQIRPKRERS